MIVINIVTGDNRKKNSSYTSLSKVEESYFALNLFGQEESFQLIDGFYQKTITEDELTIFFSDEGTIFNLKIFRVLVRPY